MGTCKKYTSKCQRQNQRLLRNDYAAVGNWDMPLIRKCIVDISGIKLIPFHQIKSNDKLNIGKTVHFFIEDSKQERVYNNPDRYIYPLAQYAHILTPDYSLYTDMPLAVQIYNVFKSRWCGAKWQEYGLTVIPTVSWSNNKSYEFCFDGIEFGSVVAISTLGVKDKKVFLSGYYELKKRINPQQVLCFGAKAFPEMGEEVIFSEYTRRIS